MITVDELPPFHQTAAAVERCARCGAPFRCGIKAGAAECWCMQAPAVTPQAEFSGCLCARCLAERHAALTGE